MLTKGITKLSELLIDADKGWNTKGITNIKQVAAAMARGDLVVRGDSYLISIPAGPPSYVLTSQGLGQLPTWAPAGGGLKYYFPVTIGMSLSTVATIPDHTISRNLPLASVYKAAYADAPADYISRLDPTMDSAIAVAAMAAADHSQNTNTPLATECGLQMLIDGAVADDGGVLTDETAAARSGAANDMTLLPAAAAVGDAYLLGSNYPAARFPLNIGTAGAGNWTLVMKYWNGAWANTVGEIESTNQFMHAGLGYWQHVPQVDWALSVISGMNLYWVRIEVTNFVNEVTQPKGTQAWWEVLV